MSKASVLRQRQFLSSAFHRLHASSSSWVKNEFLTFHFPSNIRARLLLYSHFWSATSDDNVIADNINTDDVRRVLAVASQDWKLSTSFFLLYDSARKQQRRRRRVFALSFCRRNAPETQGNEGKMNMKIIKPWGIWLCESCGISTKTSRSKHEQHKWKAKPENLFPDGLCGDFSLQNFFCYLLLDADMYLWKWCSKNAPAHTPEFCRWWLDSVE